MKCYVFFYILDLYICMYLYTANKVSNVLISSNIYHIVWHKVLMEFATSLYSRVRLTKKSQNSS